jgi:hypothetical protein
MMFNYWLSVDRTLCNQAEKFGLSVNSEPRWKKCQPQLALLGSAALLQSQVALHSDWANMYSRMAQKKWRWSLSCSVLLPVQLEGPNGFEMFWAMAIRQMSWAALYKAGMAQGDTEHGHMESNIWVTRKPALVKVSSCTNMPRILVCAARIKLCQTRWHESKNATGYLELHP